MMDKIKIDRSIKSRNKYCWQFQFNKIFSPKPTYFYTFYSQFQQQEVSFFPKSGLGFPLMWCFVECKEQKKRHFFSFKIIAKNIIKQTILITNLAMISKICKGISTKVRFFSSTATQQQLPESSFLENVSQYFDKAGEATGISKDMLNFLKSPDYSLKFNIPYRTDSGIIEVVEAFRVQHKTHRLPTKGGTRYSLHVSIEEAEALSCLMTLKNTIVGLPYGGAKGGIQVDPKMLSKRQLQRITRNYTLALAKKQSIGACVDVPGPDLGTGEREMTLIMDAYQNIYGHRDINSAAVTTGKAISHMGIRGRTESTGLGVYYCTKEILSNVVQAEKLGVTPGLKGKKFILQGFGNVGYWLAKFFVQEGAILVGVAEVDGSLYHPSGINPDELLNFKKERNRINGYIQDGHHVEYYPDESAIYKECDIFVPAAFQKSVNRNNAHKFNCKLIVEAANGPTTIEAERILLSRGIKFLPDVLCNAGGVTVSYFEWLKNMDHVRWGRLLRKWQEKSKNNFLSVIEKATNADPEKVYNASKKLLPGASERDIVYSGLEEVMSSATHEVIEIAEARNLDLRTSAYVLAITRLNDYYTTRGIDI